MSDVALTNYPLESLVLELSNIEAEERASIAAEKEAKDNRRALADRVADAREKIRDFMQENGVIQDSTSKAKLTIVKTPSKLKIDDDEAIPAEFYELEPSRNDAKIKARIASGMTVPGCRLEQSETLKVEWKK